MASILFRDVICFTPGGRVEGDCLVEDGRISEIGRVTASADRIIGCGGRWLWPGVIDSHVNFRDPGHTYKEDWTTGSSAALAGGVTTVLEMPESRPGVVTADRLESKRTLAKHKSLCNYGLFFCAGPYNVKQLDRISNVAGVKAYMAGTGGDMSLHRDEELARVFAAYNGRIIVHAENPWRIRKQASMYRYRMDAEAHSLIRDPQSALDAVKLAIQLALQHHRKIHFLNVSTQDEIDAIIMGRYQALMQAMGTEITCEVAPHHLLLNMDAYWGLDTRVIVNPPLREDVERQAMWRELSAGHIDLIASSHSPHKLEEKTVPFRDVPPGIPGVQTLLPLMLDSASRGLMKYEMVLEKLCHGPARVYGIVDRGVLREGAYADLVVIDPLMRRYITTKDQFSKCGWTPWDERISVGWPIITVINGQIVYKRVQATKGDILGTPEMAQEIRFEPTR